MVSSVWSLLFLWIVEKLFRYEYVHDKRIDMRQHLEEVVVCDQCSKYMFPNVQVISNKYDNTEDAFFSLRFQSKQRQEQVRWTNQQSCDFTATQGPHRKQTTRVSQLSEGTQRIRRVWKIFHTYKLGSKYSLLGPAHVRMSKNGFLWPSM